MKYEEFTKKHLTHKRVVQIESSCRLGQDDSIIPNTDRFSQKEEYISDNLLKMTELSSELYLCKLCGIKIYYPFTEEIKEHWKMYHETEKTLIFEMEVFNHYSIEQKLNHIKELFESDKEVSQITVKKKNEELQLYRWSFFDYYNNNPYNLNLNI